jgi:cytochrome bd-type quinol oxidase subunit 1
MFVHLPVVGCLFALVILLVAHRLREEIVFKIGYGILLFCTISSAVTYFSGGYAYEELASNPSIQSEQTDPHALIARAAFMLMVVAGVATLSVFLQYLQGEKPHPWHRRGILIAAFILVYLFAWAAHLGGRIRHEEIREPSYVFPEIQWNESGE